MPRSANPTRGNILLTTMILLIAISLVTCAILQLSLVTYRLSQRNEYLARAKALADSEFDNIYFRMKTAMMDGTTADGVPNALSDICDTPANTTDNPTTDRIPFCALFQFPNAPEHWIVRRSIHRDFTTQGTANHTTATYTYFTAKIEVTSANLPVGAIDLHLGRRMNNSISTVFQYNIFAQGDLEFAPGGTVTINGDIAANGNIYMGAQNNGVSTLIVNAAVRYLAGDSFYTNALHNGTAIAAPVFGAVGGQAAQVAPMDEPQNLLGGLSSKDIATRYGIQLKADGSANPDYNALFGTITVDSTATPDPLQLANAENLVYRSVIAPPPNVVYNATAAGADYTAEYPGVPTQAALGAISDDPAVAALRAYNRASLIITVNPDGSTSYSLRNSDGTVSPDTTDYTTTAAPGLVTQKTMYDLREQTTVAITEIDVGVLKSKLEGTTSGFDSSNTFNGLLYVYLANSTPTSPAAVRLVNGSATPGGVISASNPVLKGFSVATNGGLYVKGDYNTVASDGTTNIATDGSNLNPAMLMADAVTILSSSWNDSLVTPVTGDSGAVIAAKENPTNTIYSRIVPPGTTTTIGAGILTGNIAADSSGNYIYSGGGHNLVRFLEDWEAASVNFYGSIGRLFESTQFTKQFYSPTSATYPNVYRVPANRNFSFNQSLTTRPPTGAPSVTKFDRGTIFTW